MLLIWFLIIIVVIFFLYILYIYVYLSNSITYNPVVYSKVIDNEMPTRRSKAKFLNGFYYFDKFGAYHWADLRRTIYYPGDFFCGKVNMGKGCTVSYDTRYYCGSIETWTKYTKISRDIKASHSTKVVYITQTYMDGWAFDANSRTKTKFIPNSKK
jgi:hypothetical protein